jgi:hypothetical protein
MTQNTQTRNAYASAGRWPRPLKLSLASAATAVIMLVSPPALAADEVKPAAQEAATPTWQSVLTLQLNDEYNCILDKVLFDRDIEVGGHISKEGRARCLDGREFDFSRPSTHETFEIHLCLPTVC